MLKIHEKLLDLFKRVTSVLDENNIKWYAIGGTAIGGLREGGFILWDDDVDIMIKEEDLESFSKIDWSLYNLSNFDKNKKHATPFPKIYDPKTTIEWRETEAYLFIDIFIGYKTRSLSKLRRFKMTSFDYLLHMKNYSYKQMKQEKNILWTFPLFLIKILPISMNQLIRKYRKKIIKSKVINEEKRMQYFSYDVGKERKDIYHILDGERSVMFEDFKIFIPKEFEKTTKSVFGDIYKAPDKIPSKMDHGIELK